MYVIYMIGDIAMIDEIDMIDERERERDGPH